MLPAVLPRRTDPSMPKPHWDGLAYRDPHRAALVWAGHLGVPFQGETATLTNACVLTDELGQVLPNTWSCQLLLPSRFRYDADSPVVEQMGEIWQLVATASWLPERRQLIADAAVWTAREASPGRPLSLYRSRAEAREQLRRLVLLRDAYGRPDPHLATAVRLAASWPGSLEEYQDVLATLLE